MAGEGYEGRPHMTQSGLSRLGAESQEQTSTWFEPPTVLASTKRIQPLLRSLHAISTRRQRVSANPPRQVSVASV